MEERENTIQRSFVGEEIGYQLGMFVEESLGELMYVRFPDNHSNKSTVKITIEFYPEGEENEE
jgi:hypothetical protein